MHKTHIESCEHESHNSSVLNSYTRWTSPLLIATLSTCSTYHSGDESLPLSPLEEERGNARHLLSDMNFTEGEILPRALQTVQKEGNL